MAEKKTPALKPVGKKDGINVNSENSTTTGPNFTGEGGNVNWARGDNKDKILSRK